MMHPYSFFLLNIAALAGQAVAKTDLSGCVSSETGMRLPKVKMALGILSLTQIHLQLGMAVPHYFGMFLIQEKSASF